MNWIWLLTMKMADTLISTVTYRFTLRCGGSLHSADAVVNSGHPGEEKTLHEYRLIFNQYSIMIESGGFVVEQYNEIGHIKHFNMGVLSPRQALAFRSIIVRTTMQIYLQLDEDVWNSWIGGLKCYQVLPTGCYLTAWSKHGEFGKVPAHNPEFICHEQYAGVEVAFDTGIEPMTDSEVESPAPSDHEDEVDDGFWR